MPVRNILDANGKIQQSLLPTALESDLVSPVFVYPAGAYTSGVPVISIDGNAATEYGGSFTLNPGSNTPAGGAGVGINIKSTPYGGPAPAGGTGAAGVSVEIGTNGNNGATGSTGPFVENHLYIAGTFGLSEVNDFVYNPVQMFVNANPGATTISPEAINSNAPYNTIRTIPLGNTPADYNYFKMFLDFNGQLVDSNVPDPRVRFYISNESNGAYNAATATTSWAQITALGVGDDNLAFEDVPLIYNGTATSNQLFLNYTFANPTPQVGALNLSLFTTDYSLEASKVSQM
jgi:hypothetical protein